MKTYDKIDGFSEENNLLKEENEKLKKINLILDDNSGKKAIDER